MKYIRKTEKPITDNFLMELLKQRGLPIEDNADEFFHPTHDNENDPMLLDHMEEGYEMLSKCIKNNGKIYICVDSDVDGFTSAALTYNFLKQAPIFHDYEFTIDYHIPDGKEHGLQTIMDIFTNEKICDLIILPDSSSNDYEEHKILKEMGYDILILDHHDADHYSENAVVINNQLSQYYPNKDLSGVGVVYKFFEYFEERYISEHYKLNCLNPEPTINNYIDLVALGEISDMMNMNTIENRYICETGLTNINNIFFKELVKKQEFSIGKELTQIGVAFYITPLINALIRMGTEQQKERLFLAFIQPDIMVPSTKRGEKGMEETICTQSIRNCVNAKAQQKKEQEKAAEYLDIQIANDCLDDNKILILNADELDTPSTLTGLCAMQVSAAHKKPVMLGRISPDGYLKGSIRGRDDSELRNFKQLLLDSGLMDFVEGHPNAAGFSIKEKNIPKLIEYTNEALKDISFNEGFYEADFVVQGNCSYLSNLIEDMYNGRHYWGQQNKEPMIIVEDIVINSSDISIIGTYKDTVKFSFNGITYIKFKAKALIEKLREYNGKLHITVAGRGAINEWGGKKTPQILLEEIEVKESSVTDF